MTSFVMAHGLFMFLYGMRYGRGTYDGTCVYVRQDSLAKAEGVLGRIHDAESS